MASFELEELKTTKLSAAKVDSTEANCSKSESINKILNLLSVILFKYCAKVFRDKGFYIKVRLSLL
jgi:hypothetical protein